MCLQATVELTVDAFVSPKVRDEHAADLNTLIEGHPLDDAERTLVLGVVFEEVRDIALGGDSCVRIRTRSSGLRSS